MSRRLAAAVNLIKTWALLHRRLRNSRRPRLAHRRLSPLLDRVLRRPARGHRALLVRRPRDSRDRPRARARRDRGRPALRRGRPHRSEGRHPTSPSLRDRRRTSPRALGRARRQGPLDRVHDGAPGRGPAGGARGPARPRDRPLRAPRRSSRRRSPPWSARRCSRSVASGGCFQRATAFRARPDRVGDGARAAVAPAGTDGGRSTLPSCASHRTASRMHCSASSRRTSSSHSPVTRRLEPLYVVNPFEEQGLAALFSTHPPTAERVSRLRALDPELEGADRGRVGPRKRAQAGPDSKKNRRRPTLPGGCPPSTIGADGLNFSVRNGKRCTPVAMTAETCQRRASAHPQNSIVDFGKCSKSRPRAISTGPLHALLRFHGRPIDVVVSHGPYSLEGMGSLISRWASRLDAFSGYPVQT